MNSCWQVFRTYVPRLRFWIFGGILLLTALFVSTAKPYTPRSAVLTGLFFSIMICCITLALAAMHLRRLLSSSLPHLVPNYAGPHLVVGGAVGLACCVVLPWMMAARMGASPLHFIGLYALAGILYGLVLLWPPSLWLITVAPIVATWLALDYPGTVFLERFFDGKHPAASMSLIALAAVTYPLAAFARLRTGDRVSTFSDDVTLGLSQPAAGPVKSRLLGLRDTAIERRLAERTRRGWNVRRWQVPSLASWSEWGLLVLMSVVSAVACGLAARDPGAAAAVCWVAGAVTLFLPLSSWRLRATALAGEFMRPVSRTQFVREYFSAMACDLAGWTSIATVVSLIVYPALIIGKEPDGKEPDALVALAAHVPLLWAMAAWIYGLALATLHLRYWLPAFFGLVCATTPLIGLCIVLVQSTVLAISPREESTVLAWLPFLAALMVFTGVGLAAGWWAYRRWLKMEIA